MVLTARRPPPPPQYESAVDKYARDVVAGEVVAGKLVRLLCERHLKDLETAQEKGLYFDYEEADMVMRFFSRLKHTKGEWANQPFFLVPWESFIIGAVFGWKWAATGLRRYRTAYVEIGRKNGKSIIAAGVGLKLAFFDDEPGAEVYSAATKRDQAKIVWGDARQIVLKTPGLKRRINALVGNLHSLESGSKFEPLGADENTLDGLNIHGAIIDELHAHRTRVVWDALETGTGARRQPLIFVITTAGFDRTSICWQQHDYGVKVLEGVIEDDSYFPYIATLDEGDDWKDPSVWIKANPNLGVSVKLADLEVLCERAKQIPAAQNAFKRFRLNVWTEGEARWIDMGLYDENHKHPINREDYQGARAWVGFDLSTTVDLTARVELFECPVEEGAIDALATFWAPEETIAKRSSEARVPYDVWAEQGWIVVTEGNVVDYDYIEKDTLEKGEVHEYPEMAYDPWNATQFAVHMESQGATMVPVRQGFGQLSEPSKELERLLLARAFHHGGNPVLRWMFSNVVTEMNPYGNIRPSKRKSREKIDGVSATVIALSRAIVHKDEEESGYEEHGIRTLRDFLEEPEENEENADEGEEQEEGQED